MTANPILHPAETASRVLARGIEVIELEAQALGELARTLDACFVEACEAIVRAKGRVVVTGMGKSGHIGRKLAATLAATGTPSNFVHPAEAAPRPLSRANRCGPALARSAAVRRARGPASRPEAAPRGKAFILLE